MTERAVNEFIGKAVISDEFKNRLLSGKMSNRDIADFNSELDSQDINAIVWSLVFADGFDNFAAGVDAYLARRYRGAKPAGTGDNLPISV